MFLFRKRPEMPTPPTPCRAVRRRFPPAESHFVNGNPLKAPFPPGLEQAMFGLGCFWGAERKFWQMPGRVHRPPSAMPAAITPNPTYEEVCSGYTGHNEVVMVWFDPKKIPTRRCSRPSGRTTIPTQGMRQGNDVGTQYRSGIYTYGPAQRSEGRGLARGLSRRRCGRAAWARSRPRSTPPAHFYYAEGYHQQYLAKNPTAIAAWAVPA